MTPDFSQSISVFPVFWVFYYVYSFSVNAGIIFINPIISSHFLIHDIHAENGNCSVFRNIAKSSANYVVQTRKLAAGT
jgi:hypothetical protein